MSAAGDEYVTGLEQGWLRYEESAKRQGASDLIIATYRDLYFGGALTLARLLSRSLSSAQTPVEAAGEVEAAIRQVQQDAVSRIGASITIRKAQGHG